MGLVSNIVQHDVDLVLQDTVKKIGVTFTDGAGTLADPPALNATLTDIFGNLLEADIYYPALERTPDPPRILHPSIGSFEFPFGLDNGSVDPTRRNRTTCTGDYMITWTAALTSAVRASLTVVPGTSPNADLKWSSVAMGTPGNFITIEYINPGTPNALLSVVRSGHKIQVNLATNPTAVIITTANQIITAVNTAITDEVTQIVTVELAPGSDGTGVVAGVSETPLTGGIDASGESQVCVSTKVVTHMMCSLINKFRLMIDKTMKIINNDPSDPCYLGYTNGQLCTYLISGLQIINSYQPYGTFSLENFPYGGYDFILLETSLIAGIMSQSMFAIDTDIPQWNDQGNAFVITHYTQLAQYLNWLSQRLDKLIPAFKLHFVQSGSLHIETGPNYRLAQLINAAPSGSLFRNFYAKVG